MKFDYKLYGIGWAELEIEVDGKKYCSFPSYLSEPLIDLLEGLLVIIPGCVLDDELRSMVSFKMYQEPVVEKWTLKLIDDFKLNIVIEEFEDECPNKEKIRFDVTCDLLEFLSEVIKSVEQLLKKHGFVGYKNTWCRQDFPISSFLKLKYYYNYQTIYSTSEEVNEVGTKLEVSDLEKELKFIYVNLK